ncbi:hypothetical protein [Consotaella aegiceratis]|uniref:hypothetical protein n=1 Tax=Consotaella aegiceratis TaxID=3097961 RepID=UPI002F40C387
MACQLHVLEATADIPNSPLPLIVVRRAVAMPQAPSDVEAFVRRNGWSGTWTYTVFTYWHYHTTGHELLVCVGGSAELGLGGDAGLVVEVEPGDAAILPAGVGHKRLSSSSGFAMVGAYPPGQSGAITRAGSRPVAEAARDIAALALPDQDPLTGERPGVLAAWRSSAQTAGR